MFSDLLTPISLLILTLLSSLTDAHTSPHCKSVPSSPTWPCPSLWAHLNTTVSGRLLAPSPPGAVCHPSQPTYNASACPALQTAWTTYTFHQSDPVSSMWNQWNNDTCLPLPNNPCSGAGYPIYVINASTPAHVQAGVKFAGRHGIRLVIRSTGHDYVGRSSAGNALSIWTHHLQGLKTHDSFRLQGCGIKIDSPAVTVGAGTQMMTLYTHLATQNRTIVGGGGQSVSVGGYLTGGGHSLLSARYGLAADQVLEIEMVTPTGNLIVANECQNKDLFYAMRGGGGGTFGVMTSVTMLTHPTPKIESLFLAIGMPDLPSGTDPKVWEVIAYLLSRFPSLGDAGVAGYTYIFRSQPNPYDLSNQTTVSGMIGTLTFLDPPSPGSLESLLTPILTHITTTYPQTFQTTNVTTYPSFLSWYLDNYDKDPAGSNLYVGSRLLDAQSLTTNLTELGEAFEQFSSNGIATAYLVSGKGVRDVKPRGGEDAVNPAWRRAYVHASSCPHFLHHLSFFSFFSGVMEQGD
jgi:hypothetical protein